MGPRVRLERKWGNNPDAYVKLHEVGWYSWLRKCLHTLVLPTARMGYLHCICSVHWLILMFVFYEREVHIHSWRQNTTFATLASFVRMHDTKFSNRICQPTRSLRHLSVSWQSIEELVLFIPQIIPHTADDPLKMTPGLLQTKILLPNWTCLNWGQ